MAAEQGETSGRRAARETRAFRDAPILIVVVARVKKVEDEIHRAEPHQHEGADPPQRLLLDELAPGRW